MSDVPHSPSSNILTAVLDRMVTAGWVASYATDAQYRIKIAFTQEGLRVLSPVSEALSTLGPLSDIEMSAVAWIITTQLDKPWKGPL